MGVIGLEDRSSSQLVRILDQFRPYYLQKKLQKKNVKGDSLFFEFIEKNHKEFHNQLNNQCKSEGRAKSDIISSYLSEDQKNIYGPLFQTTEQEELQYRTKIDKIVSSSKEVKEFRRNIQPFLNPEQNEHFVGKLANLLYNNLDEKEKNNINPFRIKTYILNLGFIRISRISRKDAPKFVIKYKSLFRNEQEVLQNIVERYVDEELASTPIEKTSQRIAELKQEVKTLYEGVEK